MPEVGVSRRGPIEKNCAVLSAFLFYREAFCYFQEAKLFHYIFLKTCAVMCVKSFSFCTQMTSTHSSGKCAFHRRWRTLLPYWRATQGGSIRRTFSEMVDNRLTILTLASVLSAVCIAQN